MEGKRQEHTTRLRTAVRRSVGPHEEPEHPERSKQSRAGNSSIVTGFLYLCISLCLLWGILCCFLALVPETTISTLPAPIKVLFARPAQPVSADGPKSATQLPLSSAVTMGPLTELKTTVIKPGSGPTVSKGQRVTVHATGSVLQADGTSNKFWSTKDPGQQPFTWQAGIGQVIAGWDQGVLGMNLGETRMIHIPAKMGYGASGFPAWGIPPNADLQFEIECLQIQ